MHIIFLFFIIPFLVIVLLFVDFYFGRKQHLQNMHIYQFPIRHSNIDIFINGTELFRQMVQDMKTARHHIHVQFYIFRDDPFGSLVLELMEKKVNEGIEVRLLIDWLGSLQFPRRRMKELRKKGIEIAFCHVPRFPFFLYTSQSRNHRKIIVIDGKIGFLGGFNIGKEYVNRDEVLNPWRDCHVRFTGEGVQDLQTQFLTDWKTATNVKMKKSNYFPVLPKGDIKHRFYSFEGKDLEEKICELLRSAKRNIVIGTPYFIPGKKAFSELKQSLKRCVDITLVVPEISDHPFIKEASYRYLRQLLKLGCKVYQYRSGFYHAKVFIIDDDICSIGTANFDKRSFYYNYEMNSVFYDRELVLRMLEIAEIDLSKSTPLHFRKLERQKFHVVLKEWIAFVLSPLL